ncbi:hypothetical protein [Streptomyces sp. NBC_00878]|uniref:hypothetical protein n=1 Tax=Streptomyces sp. NBC_00878 TaxID=2975854 RepID=UPI00224ECD77|nr:hypothetical protein [Streptomyces sp. NBC_00878]MCX4906778.1 hypothetical protein [Streptomyces sp. NBC_00878]
MGTVIHVAQQEQTGPPEHRTTTVEQGSFCVARCTCGWRGPARRARGRARRDAETHSTEGS